MDHQLKREYAGEGIQGSITPTCSCGWKGRPEYAYEDYQHANVAEQEREHLRKPEPVITTSKGLLWRNGEIIPLPQADIVAQKHGYTCAEAFVRALEKQ